MFHRVLNAIKKRYSDSCQYYEQLNDLNRFNDDFAKQIAWTPIAKVGAQFCTRRMVKLGNHIIAFVPSIGFLAFCFLFIGMGGFLLRKIAHIHTPLSYYFTHFIQSLHHDFNSIFFVLKSDKWIAVPFLSLFFLAGIITLFFALRPIFFNLKEQYFFKGIFFLGFKKVILDDIHALQMISGNSDVGDYTSCELNLVLQNTERINMVCHGSDEIMRKQAKKLSEILSIPFWDMTKL